MAAGFAAVWQHADERDMRGFGGDRVIDIVAQIDRRGWIAPVEDNLQAFWMGLRMLHVFHCHDGLEIWAQAIAVKRVIQFVADSAGEDGKLGILCQALQYGLGE